MAVGGAPGEKKSPQSDSLEDFTGRPVVPLVFEQRLKLSAIFADPVFRQAWNNAMASRPALFPVGLGAEHGPQIGNNRLHQLQGWEMFKVALLREAQERLPPRPKIADTYPDSGTIEADAKKNLKTT